MKKSCRWEKLLHVKMQASGAKTQKLLSEAE
jgi:hypothetical protein